MVTPVRDCMADSVPIVVICGQVATAAIGLDSGAVTVDTTFPTQPQEEVDGMYVDGEPHRAL